MTSGRNVLELQMIEPNVMRVHFEPNGVTTPRTLVIDPQAKWPGGQATIDSNSDPMTITTSAMTVKVSKSPIRWSVYDRSGTEVITEPASAGAIDGKIRYLDVLSDETAHHYGIGNSTTPEWIQGNEFDVREGLWRDRDATVTAGMQGNGGAPLRYTTRDGVLIDSDGGRFEAGNDSEEFTGDSRPDVEYFVIVGDPHAIMHAVADISGHAPMMPKWSMGFLNTQWQSSEKEVTQIIKTYRAKQIPIDSFILDYDWKAWGEGDYGEWRWNSTYGPGNEHPDEFPDGASGEFARQMAAMGIKLGGIFKPRVVRHGPGHSYSGTPSVEETYAVDHDLLLPGDPVNLDFSKAMTREWYWQHMIPAYETGIVGFWNDEADMSNEATTPNFQNLNFERAMYDGVRSMSSTQRVWSINRNFYLGAQRYAYAQWSGDIETGFDSMREQATRMLGEIDLGESHWGMDSGGFNGHPSDENYARWIQFAAFVPVMRVHGTYGEKRQPWVYGSRAEAVAKSAIDLRYEFLPYIYAYEWEAHETGVGLVQPLFWEFPNDPNVTDGKYAMAAAKTDEWMFGDEMLAAPIFGEGQAHRSIYLPPGTWYDYFRGTRYAGSSTISYRVNPDTWSDIPLFIRAGAIVPTQDVEQYVGEHPITRVYLDVWPGADGSFTYYDDDGETYAYEHGDNYSQQLTSTWSGGGENFVAETPTGSYTPALRAFLLKVHGIAARSAMIDGRSARRALDLRALEKAPDPNAPAWATGTDRYGAVTYVLFASRKKTNIELH
ncbi:MAG TPA: TIM-barrel domain-containing protein [Candidatus Eremiobacteraceae bacterium]|nr:TIM-barrel domain-containing protein [Candidatus Eremiobacteraceae bacterium]